MHRSRIILIFLSTLALAGTAHTQPPAEDDSATRRAGRVASEPARDVGLVRTRIPPALERARDNPYTLAGTRTCGEIAIAVDELSEALGPDFDQPRRRGNRNAELAEAGGRAVINSFIPFRGVVRELSGSAEADRRMQAAVDAGIARRGFLRGIQQTRGCRR